MDAATLRSLLADNPWLEGTSLESWFERFLPEPCWSRWVELEENPQRVALVVGPRQAGKSTLIWKSLQQLGEPVLYLNCEDASIQQWLTSPALFLADLEELGAPVHRIFFEEVQALENAGLFLKGLIDRRTGRMLYATGSSAFDLEARTRESLAGRAHRHLLLPFSAAELASAHGAAQKNAIAKEKRRSLVERLLVYGGYPAVWTASAPERELADLAEAFVLRDVSDRFKIRNLEGFRKVVQLAASQIGNVVNFSEWASLGAISNDTVAEYCRLLDEAHILRLVRPFVGGKRAEITSAPKVFFLDNGLRNQIFGGFQAFEDRGDRGVLMENLVFTELSKVLNPLLDGLRYWRSKSGAEIDFVVEHQGRLLAIEVKAGDSFGKVGRGQRSFVEAYEPECLLVVSRGEHADREIGSTRVVFLGVGELAEWVRRWLAADHPAVGNR